MPGPVHHRAGLRQRGNANDLRDWPSLWMYRPTASDGHYRAALDVRTLLNLATVLHFFFGGITHGQYLQLEHDLAAAERVVAVDGDGLLIHAGDQEALGLALVILHQNGRTHFLIFLGHVFQALRDDEGFIPGTVKLVAVDGHLEGVTRHLAFQFPGNHWRQHFIDAVYVAEGIFNLGEDAIGLHVDDFVPQLDVLTVAYDVFDDFTHDRLTLMRTGYGWWP